ncbi:uncharacterized protein GO595_000636 [Histomonas meleagridis]|uniref:uncharacterized protein n=1 Tax=Histomonas meleagridis TaxID=135588 RepID=UPI00355A1CC2|nr:hypothetical protein GO595_000636 [Histomonas meleagridis]
MEGFDKEDLMNFLKSRNKDIPDDQKLPELSGLKLTTFLDQNKSKLVLVIFTESKHPLLNIFHQIFVPLIKENERTTAACVCYIDQNKDMIAKYEVQHNVEFVYYYKGKEVKRFDGSAFGEAKDYLLQNKPKDLFAGSSHTIGPCSSIDAMEYFNTKRVKPTQYIPKEVIKQEKALTQYNLTEAQKEILNNLSDFLDEEDIIKAFEIGLTDEDEITDYIQKLQEENEDGNKNTEDTQASIPVPVQIPRPQISDEEKETLIQELSMLGYTDEEIDKAIEHGCVSFEQSEQFISDLREGKVPTAQPSSEPPQPSPPKQQELTPEQEKIFEQFSDFLDPDLMRRALLESGTADETDVLNYYEQLQKSGATIKPQPSPPPVSPQSQPPIQKPVSPPPSSPSSNSLRQSLSSSYGQHKLSQETQKILEKKLVTQKIKEQRIEENARQAAARSLRNEAPQGAPQSSPRKSVSSNEVAFNVRVPGSNVRIPTITLSVEETFHVLERKLKDGQYIDEEAYIQFQIPLGGIVTPEEFGLTFKEKRVTGKKTINVMIIKKPE